MFGSWGLGFRIFAFFGLFWTMRILRFVRHTWSFAFSSFYRVLRYPRWWDIDVTNEARSRSSATCERPERQVHRRELAFLAQFDAGPPPRTTLEPL